MDAALPGGAFPGLFRSRLLMVRLRRGVQHALDHLVAAARRLFGGVLIICLLHTDILAGRPCRREGAAWKRRCAMWIVAQAISVAMLGPAIAQSQTPAAQNRPSQQQADRPGSSQDNAQSQETPPAPQSPSVTRSQPEVRSRTAAESQSEAQRQQDNWLERFYYDVRITDVLIVLFTLALVIATVLLWHATLGLWGAANAANELNRQNMIASRRAWLSISDVKLKHPTTVTEDAITFSVSVTVKNHGQTPALNTAVWFDSYLSVPEAESSPMPKGVSRIICARTPFNWADILSFPTAF
jgi:hypothetical protein